MKLLIRRDSDFSAGNIGFSGHDGTFNLAGYLEPTVRCASVLNACYIKHPRAGLTQNVNTDFTQHHKPVMPHAQNKSHGLIAHIADPTVINLPPGENELGVATQANDGDFCVIQVHDSGDPRAFRLRAGWGL